MKAFHGPRHDGSFGEGGIVGWARAVRGVRRACARAWVGQCGLDVHRPPACPMSQSLDHADLQALLADTLRAGDAAGAVICLCAAWCRTCDDFRPGFEQARAAHPRLAFRWVDIEDEADLLGDIDIETFPTLVIGGRDGRVRFAGPVLPQAGQIPRLLQSLGL